MTPQIEFTHVLRELSVNRNDPCEVLRELISNSYDAGAKNLLYVPLKDQDGLIFLDDGSGLDPITLVNGITPWEAFFSIGKSTKQKGNSIGYKCQGSKLCFASSRILVATKPLPGSEWYFKVLQNPRSTLDITTDISPAKTGDIIGELRKFFSTPSADTANAITELEKRLSTGFTTSTLLIIDGLDTESFTRYFSIGKDPHNSYVVNYIQFCTSQGDVRNIKKTQGFTGSEVLQVAKSTRAARLEIFANKKSTEIPFGFPYLPSENDPTIKSPQEISRLRDGRFFARAAKKFTVQAQNFSIILAVDGNRRAHEGYATLDRKGSTRSGIRLSDHRGVCISVRGIRICKYPELLSSIPEFSVLVEGDSISHYTLVIDGDFDLVTNRNALSKRAFDTLTEPDFIEQVRIFLRAEQKKASVFSELLSRLKRESSETLLNEQIENLENARSEVKSRARLRVTDQHGTTHLFLAPRAGEEYLVGVLYSQLATMVPSTSPYAKYWKRVITFSTQGVDSLGLRDEQSAAPLASENLCSIEYKYEFSNAGPFNHALAVVDFIVAWEISDNFQGQVRDTFTCFGQAAKVATNTFEWEISDIENEEGGVYPQKITVVSLRNLIKATFNCDPVVPPPP